MDPCAVPLRFFPGPGPTPRPGSGPGPGPRALRPSLLTQGRASLSSSALALCVSLAHVLLFLSPSQIAPVARKGEAGLWKKATAAAARIPAARASPSDGLCQSRTFKNAANRSFFFFSSSSFPLLKWKSCNFFFFETERQIFLAGSDLGFSI